MATLRPDVSIRQVQFFIKEVYDTPNNRHFGTGEMLNNIQRFAMRGIKGIRKGDLEKTKKNLIISFSWFLSFLNRLQINLEDETWKRFPFVCSYCNSRPCACKVKRPEQRLKVDIDDTKRPRTLASFQQMFDQIYPHTTRSIEHAGVHLAEEVGEFSEAIWAYRSNRTQEDFDDIALEAADYFSCLVGVFNSLKFDLALELSRFYPNNCHECTHAPCVCSFEKIKKYKS
jgi:NTP pyrophosphatase (non-canonical NTP hydrolase)